MKHLFLLLPVLILLGCFPPESYRVYYHGSNFTKGKPPTDSKSYSSGESAKILGKGNLENDNYTFLGWRYYYELRSPGEYITINYDDVNLFAVWDDGYDTPFTFEIKNDEVIITRYNDIYFSTVTIPNTLQGKPVTAIDDSVFSNSEIFIVNLSKNLKHIGINAFASNNISLIFIPDSVESVGTGAFKNNDLQKVTLGNGLNTIAPLTFMNNSLTDITIPENIKTIGEGAFSKNDIDYINISANVAIMDDVALGNYGESFKAYYDAQGKSAGHYNYIGADTWVKY